MARTQSDRPVLLRLIPLLRLLLLVSLALIVIAWWSLRSEQGSATDAAATGSIGGTDAKQSTTLLPLDERVSAPEFELPLFDGVPLQLSDLRGQVVVLNFWASWCPPCRAEAPTFARVSAAFRERGVVFVGVNIQDNDADARQFIKEFGIAYPNGPDRTLEITTAYAVATIPTTIFVDAEGRIARRWMGSLTEQQLVSFVEGMLR